MPKSKSSLYRFDGRLFEICFVSSDGPTITDFVIADSMSEAVENIERVSSGPIYSCKQLIVEGAIRFTTEKAQEFLQGDS